MELFSWSLKRHGFSIIKSRPWAKTSNFGALTVYFEIILKKLCNSYGNILLTKNALNCLKITRRFSIFQNYFKNSLKTASVWPYRNIWLTLYIVHELYKGWERIWKKLLYWKIHQTFSPKWIFHNSLHHFGRVLQFETTNKSKNKPSDNFSSSSKIKLFWHFKTHSKWWTLD